MSKPTIEEDIRRVRERAPTNVQQNINRIEARLGEGIPGEVQDLLCAVSDWVWGGELAWTGHSPELLKAFREKVRNQKARLGELEAFVRDEANHSPSCAVYAELEDGTPAFQPCSCGLSALLEKP